VLVENEHHREMFLEDIVIDGFSHGPIYLTCRSWVHSKFDNPQKRVFFTNKVIIRSISLKAYMFDYIYHRS
jgi:lipoxygenase